MTGITNISFTQGKKVFILLSLLCMLAFRGMAQSSTTITQQVDVSLTNVIELKFVATGTSTGTAVSMPISTIANYTNGVTSSTYQLTASSTKDFNVTVKTNAANFTYSGTYTTGTTMPVSGKLKLQLSGNNTGGSIGGTFASFTSLSSTDQNIITNGTSGNNKTFSVQYQAIPGLAYPAGTYTTSVIYTATQL